MKRRFTSLIIFFITVLSLTLFSFAEDVVSVPNEIITDNPEREVTTVESMKTRDHATLSLSVDKVIPEEIMGKLENGKLKVYISKINEETEENKGKVKAVGNADGIDVSKLRLKAYSNNKNASPIMPRKKLSAEDIRKMKNEISSEKKINVVENTDEYVILEIENVNPDEKIYISVLNGNKVIKSYRIGDVSLYNSRIDSRCWEKKSDLIATSYDKSSWEMYNSGDTSLKWMDGHPHLKIANGSAGIYKIELGSASGTELSYKDEILDKSFSGNLTKDGQSGFRLHIGNDGNSNVLLINDGKYSNNDLIDNKQSSLSKDNLIFGIHNSNDDLLNRYTTFKILNGMGQKYYVSNPTKECIPSQGNGIRAIEGATTLGFRMGIQLPSNLSPGIYDYKNAISVKVYQHSRGQNKTDKEIFANYIIDIKEDKIKEYKKTFYFANGSNVLKDPIELESPELSFMYKDNNKPDKRGLWISYDGKDEYLMHTQRNGNYEVEKEVTWSNNKKAKIKIVQKNGENAKVTFTPIDLNSENTFDFTIWQGRYADDSGHSGQKHRKIRQRKHTIEYKQATGLSDVIVTLDPRMKQISDQINGNTRTWITLGKQFGTDGSKADLSGMIGIKGNYDNATKIEGEFVNGIQMTDLRINNILYRIYDQNNERLAVKKNIPLNSLISSDNILISPKKDTIYNTVFKQVGQLGKEPRYSSKIEVKYDNTAVAQTGYTGNGTVDSNDMAIGTIYTFPTNGNGIVNGNSSSNGGGNPIQMTGISGNLPNGNGLNSVNNGGKIANKIVVTKNGSSPQNNNNGSTVTVDGLTFGVDGKDGGLTLKKENNFTQTEDSTYNIKYYYTFNGNIGVSKNEILLSTFTLTVKSKIEDIGSLTLKVDPRLKQLMNGRNDTWITGKGSFGVSNSKADFPSMLKVEKNYKPDINGVAVNGDKVTVDNQSYASPTTQNGYKIFGNSNGNSNRKQIAIKDRTILDQITNNDNLMLSPESNAEYQTIFKANNTGKKYSSAIKLEYINDNKIDSTVNAYKGSGTLDSVEMENDYTYTFGTSHNGTATGTNGANNSITMTEVKGQMPNGKGLQSINGGSNIVNEILVTLNGNTSSMTNGGTVVVDNITFSIDNTGGGLKINKGNNFNNETDKTYKIEFYYKGKGSTGTNKDKVLLSSFDLKIKSKPRYLEGIRIITLDPRIKQLFTQLNKEESWITFGGNFGSWSGEKVSLSQFIKRSGQYQLGSVVTAEIVNNKKKSSEKNGYSVFRIENSKRDDIAIKNGVQINGLHTNNNVMMSPEKENTYNIVLAEANTKRYLINLETKYAKDNNITENEGYQGSGTIDSVEMADGVEYVFAPEKSSGGNAQGTSTSNGILQMTEVTGYLPNGKGLSEINGGQVIANKVEVIKNGQSYSDSNTATVDNIIFGISNDGGLTIRKDNRHNIITDTVYTVKLLHSFNVGNNEKKVVLSTFSLKIRSTPQKLADKAITLDPRIKQLFNPSKARVTEHNWITFDGNFGSWSGTKVPLSEFIKPDSNLLMGSTVNVETVNHKVKNAQDNGYSIFNTKTSGRDEVAIKNNVQINVLHTNNNVMLSPEKTEKYNIIFIESNGSTKRYSTSFETKYANDNGVSQDGEPYKGNGEIESTKMETGVVYIFSTNNNNGTAEGNSSVSGIPLQMTKVTGSLLNGKGLQSINSGKVIANKITVTHKTTTKIIDLLANNTIQTIDGLTFGIDQTGGGLTIKKDSNLNGDKDYTINFLYSPSQQLNGVKKDVVLSTFDLKVIGNKPTFEIDGNNVFDFGNMVYRPENPTETRVKSFKVKNPENKNIEFSVPEATNEMHLMTNGAQSQDKIDLKDIKVTKKNTDNKSFDLQATAVLTKTTKPGSYQGELEVVVTVTNKK